ncbi:MAG: hypothetical protein JWM34_1417 [Ilumatobacteraceae bacterium]|nr:hypothetical protein [Ilumatobacteraceae bacterium]
MGALEAALRELDVFPAGTSMTWERLTGGYHNDVFRVRGDDTDVVVKHFVADSGNPLYPQRPRDEAAALERLRGTGLAPLPVAFLPDASGRALLVYGYVDGPMWDVPHGVREVGAMLGRLHALGITDGFRALPAVGSAVVAQARAMLAGVEAPQRLVRQLGIEPPPSLGAPTVTLVHTDCGPGNIVVTPAGPCLIDWQCPGIGDPVEDLANFASPAIQVLYARPPLDAAGTHDLLDAHGSGEATERFAAERWPYHVRLAAYCAHRRHELATSQPDIAALYGVALDAELDLLETRP